MFYGLSAGKGGWATYKIDELRQKYPQGYPYPTANLKAGDTLKFVIESLSNFSVYDKNNITVMSWVMPTTTCYWNGSYSQINIGSYIEPFYITGLLSEITYILLYSCIPFSPKGEEFWRRIEPYALGLQIGFTQNKVTLTMETFEHFSTTLGNTTSEVYLLYDSRADIESATGVLLAYQESLIYANYYKSGSYVSNYSISSSFGMTLTNTSVSGVTSLALDPVATLSVSLGVVLVILLIASFSSRRRRLSGAMSKDEALRGLSSEDLMKLAKAVPGSRISGETSRSELTRMIKQSFSLEEIKNKLESG